MSYFNAVFSQAGRNFKKTWGSQLFTLLSVTFSILIFVFFFLVYLNLLRAGSLLGNELRLVVYLEEGAGPELHQQLQDRINRQARVDKIEYVSQQEAFSKLREQLGPEQDVLDGLQPSFLPASLEIYPARDLQNLIRLKELSDFLSTLPGVAKVQYGQEWVARFSSFTRLVRTVVLFSAGLLILTTIFMVSQTIRLTLVARREELELYRLLGANNSYIRGPLLLEGFLQGALGSLIGLSLLYLLFQWIKTQVLGAELLGTWEITYFSPAVLAAIIGTSIGLCVLGSLITSRKFMRI